MREIKFRAWDGKEMITNIHPPFYLICSDGVYKLDPHLKENRYFKMPIAVEVMQYTGLKDKNGKEIYEGDIVKGYRASCKYLREKKWIGIIEYAKVRCAFVVRIKDNDGVDTFTDLISCTYDMQVDVTTLTDYQHEVIGNIYENPELCSQPLT